ncbi:unnamed protein product [Rotaria sp. Silwood2]|nr:unnamed protein product [Rotaria sp. Silwood2]CAF4269213.1 unnamed protein product [Rotaria sp. Silwood2]
MASFEPIVVVFGSSKSIAAVNLRLPVSLLLAFDVASLEELVSVTPQIADTCLSRFFVILLDSIDDAVLERLKENHRVKAVYRRDIMDSTSQEQMNRMTNSFKQLTLDLSNDIVRFLTTEGEKQVKLERIPLVKIYFQQARILKQWVMSFFKAEPCHILLISLNSSQENMDSAQQRLQKIVQNTEDVNLSLPLPITVYNPEQSHLFMAHQRTIDTLLCMPHTLESKAEMLAEFRCIFNDNQEILVQIDNFENTYHSNAAVQWYTRDSFVWRAINQALRSSNADAMFKLRYILTDIYAHLDECYRQMYRSFRISKAETFYRGQLMSREEFDLFKELRGSIISINTFLSTTASMQIALMYAGKYHENSNLISVVFSIETNSATLIRPYANISHYSMFNDEEETLFAMGSVFRIGNIRPLPNADNVWVIYLQTVDKYDDRFSRISSATQ